MVKSRRMGDRSGQPDRIDDKIKKLIEQNRFDAVKKLWYAQTANLMDNEEATEFFGRQKGFMFYFSTQKYEEEIENQSTRSAKCGGCDQETKDEDIILKPIKISDNLAWKIKRDTLRRQDKADLISYNEWKCPHCGEVTEEKEINYIIDVAPEPFTHYYAPNIPKTSIRHPEQDDKNAVTDWHYTVMPIYSYWWNKQNRFFMSLGIRNLQYNVGMHDDSEVSDDKLVGDY